MSTSKESIIKHALIVLEFTALIMLHTVSSADDSLLSPLISGRWHAETRTPDSTHSQHTPFHSAAGDSPFTPGSFNLNSVNSVSNSAGNSPCGFGSSDYRPLQSCETSHDLLKFVECTERWALLPDVSNVYQKVLRQCASFQGFSVLGELIHSMMDQNAKRGINKTDISVWDTFFDVYFNRDNVPSTKFFIYISKMYDRGSNQRPTTQIFNTILRGIATNNNFEKPSVAEEIVMDTEDSKSIMHDHRVEPNEESYALLMQIYAKNECQRDIRKATDVLLALKQVKVSPNNLVLGSYTQCFNGSTVSDYNAIIHYLYQSLHASHLESASIAEWLYQKCMKVYSVQPDVRTYLLMMKMYAGIDAKVASNKLWADYEQKGLAEHVENRKHTYTILLEFFGIQSRQHNGKDRFRALVALKRYQFDPMSDWEAVRAVLDVVESTNEFNQSELISQIFADALFIPESSSGSVLDQTWQYLMSKIAETRSMIWWFDPSIPSKEIYQWIMKMFHQTSHHTLDATLILSNALNSKLFTNVTDDPIIFDYLQCFEGADINVFNQVLEQLDKWLLEGKTYCLVIAEYVFMHIMPHYDIAPNTQSYILLMKMYIRFDPHRVKELMHRANREKDSELSIMLFLLCLQGDTQKRSGSWDAIQKELGFDFLLTQPAMYENLLKFGELNNGDTIVKNLIGTSLYRMPLGIVKNKPGAVRWYLMKVVQLIHDLGMYDELPFWLPWLAYQQQQCTDIAPQNDTMQANIKQLGMELAFLSLGYHDRVSKCISIIKSERIFNEIYTFNSSIMSHGFRLDLTQFNVKKDRLQIWWVLKYVMYKIVIPSPDILVIEGNLDIYELIRDKIFKDIAIHCIVLETRNVTNMVIRFNDLLELKSKPCQANNWNALEVSGSEYSGHI
eukprot:59073_1